ncbi:MAG: rhodanese-related sulfurtransferase [Pseudomonadota bacterium]
MSYVVAALYKFVRFANPGDMRVPLLRVCDAWDVRGTLLLASEGVNGTISGSRAGIDAVLAHLRALPGCEDLEHKESAARAQPFRRMKVRVKAEIVTLGQGPVDPSQLVGTYVDPSDWNALIARDDVAVIDTRNDYEVAIGSFEGAVDPQTPSFRDFPAWWEANRDRFDGKKVAMFCTGGIRCEKSTSWLKAQGVGDVFHLRGGILKYLEEVPADRSLWRGDCFVFDDRVSVGHGLEQGDHVLCHACRRPLAPADLSHPSYRRGVSCHYCIDEYSDADRARFAERQRQIDLAKARGEDHLATGIVEGERASED